MAYTGTITLISGLTQANGQDYPLVNASAVYVEDDEYSRLSDLLASILARLTALEQGGGGVVPPQPSNTDSGTLDNIVLE